MLTMMLQNLFFKGVKTPPKRRWQMTAEKLGSIESVFLNRNDGRLKVVLISPNATTLACSCMAGSVVILAHPISKRAKYFFTESGRAEMYLRRGATVVLFDYNGFGESDRIDLYYWKDAQAVLMFVKKKYPGKQCVLHGTSFGAFHIVRASVELPIDGTLVLENVNKSLISYWKRWPVTYFCVWLLERLRVSSIRDMNVSEFVRRFERKDLTVKFIACELDTLTTHDEMEELYSVLAAPLKSFHSFPDATHLMAINKNHSLYQQVLNMEKCQLC